MKKMLMLVLVLAIASLANAQLQLSVGGDYGVSAISVTPGANLSIGIGTDATISEGISFSVVCSAAAGTVTTLGDGTSEYIGPLDGGNIMGFIYGDGVLNGMVYPGDEDGAFGGIGVFGGSGIVVTSGTVDLFNLINLYATDNLILKLYIMDNDEPTMVVGTADSVAVTIIPEPITMTLLGIGGLFLRRRK